MTVDHGSQILLHQCRIELGDNNDILLRDAGLRGLLPQKRPEGSVGSQ
jgi:hypothetical protein